MITYALCIRKIREDGYARVYIRITKDRTVTYMGTEFTVHKKKVSGTTIKDAFTIAEIAPIISKFVERMNKVDAKSWTAKEVSEYLQLSDGEISFTDFYKKYTDIMICDGRENSASNYICAIKSLTLFTGVNRLNFSDITSNLINSWITSLKDTRRAKNAYPNCISTVFKAGILEYNDYDRDIIRIKNQPFIRVIIPRSDKGEKRAVSVDVLRKLFNSDVSSTEKKVITPLAIDVALLSFCLAGINTADLYFMEQSSFKDGKLRYKRHKTESKREDGAYFEISVPKNIEYLLDKYKGVGSLFSFSDMYYDNNSFNKYLNEGLKEVCRIAEIPTITTYTLRHSWATIAQNDCEASTELVGFALNHASAHKITEGYIRKNYAPVDMINQKVIDFVFNAK